MITPEYCQMMAKYNAWQNQSLYGAADGLDQDARELERGAFFGSIRGTLSHLLWGDRIWMSRFDGSETSGGAIGDSTGLSWSELLAERPKMDARIAAWSWSVLPDDLVGAVSWYSRASNRDLTQPYALCIAHFFNHQTHHRGQVHGMLTAAGARPDDTDLFLLPEEVPEWH